MVPDPIIWTPLFDRGLLDEHSELTSFVGIGGIRRNHAELAAGLIEPTRFFSGVGAHQIHANEGDAGFGRERIFLKATLSHLLAVFPAAVLVINAQV